MNEEVIARVEFDTKLKTYWLLNIALVLAVTVAGLVLVPFWLLGWGQWWTRRHYENLMCELRTRSLFFKKGILFKTEKTIPLNNIQDLTLKEGPLLKAFGLCSLGIETAGTTNPQAGHDMTLIGVVNAREFRDQTLSRRDQLESAVPTPAEPVSSDEILVEIRECLLRIESKLTQRKSE